MGRDQLLKSLQSKLLSAATSTARPHVLLVGPRGSGKSHVIEVALHRAAQEPAFAERVVIVRIPEDAVGITRYLDLLAAAIRTLETSPAAAPTSDAAAAAAQSGGPALRAGANPARIGRSRPLPVDQSAREELIAELLGGRVLLLVIENLDRVFADFKLAGQRSLRAWVETSGQVMLLASTPLLFPEVQDREQPWFGGFATFLLPDLEPDEGRQLLTRIAASRGDTDLVQFLDSPTGIARVKALAQITGGSPRIWMILADLVTQESLDDLIAAVKDLLEGLVPYYQQLLWGLSSNERRLVAALASAGGGGATVSQLAQAAELEQRVAAATLGRLADSRWVAALKPSETADRRSTYYRLREPMLRHHMQYRGGPDEPLELIVNLLRGFYDRTQQLGMFLAAEPDSLSELTLAATIGDAGSAGATWQMNPQSLQLQARFWIADDDPDYRQAGRIIDGVLCLAMGNFDDFRKRMGTGQLAHLSAELEAAAVAPEGDAVTRTGRLLSVAAQECTADRAGLLVRMVSICWTGPVTPAQAAARLLELSAEADLDPDDRVALEIGRSLVTAHLEAGALDTAISEARANSESCLRALGPDHPDTLTARHNLAYAHRLAGDLGLALPLYEAVLADRVRVLGPDHPRTLTTRNNLADACRWAGDLRRAIPLYEAVLADRVRVLGPDHPDTLTTRHGLADAYGYSGSSERAIQLLEDVLADKVRVLGREHPSTLASQNELAWVYRAAGDVRRAVAQHEAVLAVMLRVLGPDHPHTLGTRNLLAVAYRGSNDIGRAITLHEEVLADKIRVLGADHPHTLTTRNNLAAAYLASGDSGRAIQEFEAVLADKVRVLGPDHRYTLNSRNYLARAYQAAGDLGRAIPLFEAVLADRVRILGPDHPDTRLTRGRLALARQQAGDLAGALVPYFGGSLHEAGLEETALDSSDEYLSEVIWRIMADVKAGAAPPVIDTTSEIGQFVARLLAAANGDEAARLSLPPEILPLLDQDPGSDP